MAFQQGLSGLASASKSIDVTSNNIANTSTAGFKAGSAQFSDVFASALTGASSGVQVGIGSSVNAVKQAFTQGNLSTTNNPLDLGINGGGFFRIERNDGTFGYSRNGQFDIDNQGFIVNAQGERLSGYQVDTTTKLVGNVLGSLQIPQDENPPQATGASTGGVPGVAIRGNLDSREGVPDITPFDPLAVPPPIASYNSTTSLTVYDSLGNPHTLSLYMVRTTPETARSWDVFASLDGGATGPSVGNVVFEDDGIFDSALSLPITFSATAIELDNGAADLSFPIDLSNLTQFGSSFSITDIQQNGFSSGQVAGYSVSRDGIIQGRYTNGQTLDLGRVALFSFRSPNGLISLGNNLWAATPDSGPALDGIPGTGLNGVISAGQVEDSNVDLTQELVQLIIQQRNYQANAQSIRTQDQILQTLVNLR